jgi:hypothetical protein
MNYLTHIYTNIWLNYKDRKQLRKLISKYELLIDAIIYKYPNYENKESDLKKLSDDLVDLEYALKLHENVGFLFNFTSEEDHNETQNMINDLFVNLLNKKNEIKSAIAKKTY